MPALLLANFYTFFFSSLVQVPDDVMMKCQFTYIEQGDPVPLEELGQNNSDPVADDGYHGYLDNCFSGLLEVSFI